jgi:hypothetical protein
LKTLLGKIFVAKKDRLTSLELKEEEEEWMKDTRVFYYVRCWLNFAAAGVDVLC